MLLYSFAVVAAKVELLKDGEICRRDKLAVFSLNPKTDVMKTERRDKTRKSIQLMKSVFSYLYSVKERSKLRIVADTFDTKHNDCQVFFGYVSLGLLTKTLTVFLKLEFFSKVNFL